MPTVPAKPKETAGSGSAASRRAKSAKSSKPRHVPQRTCIVCKQVRPKRELIRVVRTPQGHVEVDASGKRSGRGAYLCARRSCWEPALKRGKLEQEFNVTLLAEDRAALEAFLATLPLESAAPARSAPPPARRRGDITPESR